ncbi:hypothetical protein [Mongoliimonas terrestris]|uniref:hypothetical protein n=1 Tax=Mongoliimonas terrestris TaxID=1709001 RepID=UPI0009498B9C|nr:hypothetical protein [Mongoliimonas terrestris]
MIGTLPLTLVPLIVYNIFAFRLIGLDAGDPWLMPLLTVEMLSGARFTLTSGDVLVILAIALLFGEVIKATRIGAATLGDHFLSMLVFVVYLVEFLTVPVAAHSVFAILMVIAFIDVVAGFSVTIRTSRRDIGIGTRDL